MHIQKFFPIEKFILDVEKELFKEGSIIEGEIVDIEEEFILLNLERYGVIKADTKIDINPSKDKTIKFLVKNIEEDRVELTPIYIDEDENNHSIESKTEENIISNILDTYEIVEDDISRKYVKTLFKFNLPLTKSNVFKGLKILDKLERIYYKSEDEKVICLCYDSEVNFKNQDIKKFLIVHDNEYVDNKDLSFIFKDLFSLFPEDKIDNQLIKIITYFVKNNIKFSLNNIKHFYELDKSPGLFSENLLKSINLLIENSEEKFNKVNIGNLGRFKITFGKEDIKEMRNYYETIKKGTEELISSIKKKDTSINKEIAKNIESLNEKLDFLNEMSRHLTLFYIPFYIENKNYTGMFSILNKNQKRKNKNNFKNFSVFVELDMKNLKNVKIYCEFMNEIIDIKFDIAKDYIEFFKLREEKLKNLLSDKGFKINNISYIMNNGLNLIDTLIVNTNPFYYLDVQV